MNMRSRALSTTMDGHAAALLHALLANDDPAKLAQGLKAALDQTNSVKAK